MSLPRPPALPTNPSPSGYSTRYVACLALCGLIFVTLMAVRLIEVESGHTPTGVLDTVLLTSVGSTFALIAAGRTWHA